MKTNIQKAIENLRPQLRSENKIIQHDFNFAEQMRIFKKSAGENFDLDQDNENVVTLLIHYFNHSAEFEKLQSEQNYKLHKGIMLVGPVGTGKTGLFETFREYCKTADLTDETFRIAKTRDIGKHYMQFQNLNRFTFNEHLTPLNQKTATPQHWLFDDLGLEPTSIKYYGNEINPTAELMLDRYEVFVKSAKKTHITTNLDANDIAELYGLRIADRFREMFNVIPLLGASRRK